MKMERNMKIFGLLWKYSEMWKEDRAECLNLLLIGCGLECPRTICRIVTLRCLTNGDLNLHHAAGRLRRGWRCCFFAMVVLTLSFHGHCAQKGSELVVNLSPAQRGHTWISYFGCILGLHFSRYIARGGLKVAVARAGLCFIILASGFLSARSRCRSLARHCHRNAGCFAHPIRRRPAFFNGHSDFLGLLWNSAARRKALFRGYLANPTRGAACWQNINVGSVAQSICESYVCRLHFPNTRRGLGSRWCLYVRGDWGSLESIGHGTGVGSLFGLPVSGITDIAPKPLRRGMIRTRMETGGSTASKADWRARSL